MSKLNQFFCGDTIRKTFTLQTVPQPSITGPQLNISQTLTQCYKRNIICIDLYNLRPDKIRLCAQADDGTWIAYELVANVQAWKRNVKLVIIHELLEDGSIKTVRLIACTNMDKDGGEVLFAYHSRFQIEILYRDAKQHLGLTHCQARNEQKIHFYLNASLTAVSVAKAAHYLEDSRQDQASSLADIKTLYANELLLERFISTFGISPNMSKIKVLRDAVTNFGRMAA